MKYNDIYLVPRYSSVPSRNDCDTWIEFFGHWFDLPVVPANMPAIINIPLALELAKQNYFYILHRFMHYKHILEFVKVADAPISISVGVKKRDYDLIDDLYALKQATGKCPHFITIDVAHGHSKGVRLMIQHVKRWLPDTVVIAGNVGSVQGFRDLQDWGADCIKIGIGNGRVCTTYPSTGFYCHPATLLAELQDENWVTAKIIADGGVAEPGDIAKAIALGADMVMVGGMLAGHEESPGEVIQGKDGGYYKHYYGNASAMNGSHNIEGMDIEVPLRGSIFDTLTTLKQHLQSSISYAGGDKLDVLKYYVEWQRYNRF